MDFKVCPEIEFALFPSSEGFNRASTIWLTTECSSILAGIQLWFPVKHPHCFPLQRGDNLWIVFGWSSQLRLLQLMEIWTWQLPGEKLETYCHSSLIWFFFCAVSNYCHSRQFHARSEANKSSPNDTEFLCCDSGVTVLHPAVPVKSAGWSPSLRWNKPSWSLKLISVPLWKSLIQPKTWVNGSPGNMMKTHMSNWIFPPITCVANQQRWRPHTVTAYSRPRWLRIIMQDFLLFDSEAQAAIEASL